MWGRVLPRGKTFRRSSENAFFSAQYRPVTRHREEAAAAFSGMSIRKASPLTRFEDIFMKGLTYLQPADAAGDPDPALLVDMQGNPVTGIGGSHSTPESWAISSLVPGSTFVDYLVNSVPPIAGAMVVHGDAGVPALVIVLQLGGWQHRVIVPLLGQVIAAYLEAVAAADEHVALELSASGLTQMQRFDVHVPAGMLTKARAVLVAEPQRHDISAYRREMGMRCMMMRKPDAVPVHPAAQPLAVLTVGRVWPPELPLPS